MSRTAALILLVFLILCPIAVIAAWVIPRPKPAAGEIPIPVSGAESISGCGGMILPEMNSAYEQSIVEQTNEIRMQAGLSPLKRVNELNNSARYHSADLGTDNYFNHNTFDRKNGALHEVCDTWHRIESFYPAWLALAENIAAGQQTPQEAMHGWMNSKEHRDNILSDAYWEIGVGYYEGAGKYHYYWVQNFAKPLDRYPLVIEGEKARTNQRKVQVYLYGDWVTYRLRNDAENWSDWMSFKTISEWTLPETPGTHTVSAEMRQDSESASASDTIELINP
jgi:uncharacterized protein YkwD